MNPGVTLVSGASSGIGLELVKHFIHMNWIVIGLARNSEKLSQMRVELGPNFCGFVVDVSKRDEMVSCFEAVKKKVSSIDVLVNNASVFKLEKFSACSLTDIDTIIDTNLKGTLYCTHLALGSLTRGSGRIINIASVAGIHGLKNQSIYCASKFGVDGFAEAFGQEIVESGISMTTICPGGIDTPLWNDQNNPYPGGSKHLLLKSKDIVKLVQQVIEMPFNVVLKKIITFPINEWH